MGAFVLGILVGWLAEWLFFNFWIKGRSTGEFADCTALKNEVSRKNTEISALKSELETAKKSLSDASKEKPHLIKETKTTESNDAKTTTSVATKSTAKKTAVKKATAPKKSESKKQSPAKKSQPVKKTTAKKADTKKSTSKKSSPKKVATTKKVVTKKTTKRPKTGDDLTKLSGIGPSMASTMNELGIDTYKKLADMDDDILRDMLEASGARLNNNKDAMDTWNEQAALADKGDMEGLKKLQDSLKK